MKSKYIVAVIISIMAMTCQAQITLGSRRAVRDSLTGDWLCSIPEGVFGSDYSATFHTTEPWTDITIDGDTVLPGTNYTFTQVTGDRKYALVAHIGDSVTVTGNICFTFLPILELNGAFNDDYQVTHIIANMPMTNGPITMLSKVKHRGGSTNKDPREKRNYHIKFLNASDSSKMDRRFFGLRNDNSWLLDAGQIDMLRIRNRVTTELWMDMASKPYYADREPNAMLGVRGDFVEIFLNGKYHGFFALTEAMDRKQMKLAKYEEPDSVTSGKFHGMLWKTKVIDVIARMTYFYGYNNTKDTWGGFEVKYPDPDDFMPTDYSTLGNAVRFVANSTNEEFRQHVGEYFDIPVIMDYWILINAILGVDSGIKNIYWAVYDKQQDKKLTLAAWDLDCTFGQFWLNPSSHYQSYVSPTKSLGTFNRLFLRLHELNPDSFCVKAVERYQLLRSTLLSENSLKNRFRSRLEPLRRCGAVARETVRWSGVYDLSWQPLNFDNEMQYIENWIDQRMTYLDNSRFRPYLMGDSNRDGKVDVSDVNKMVIMILNGEYPVWYEDMNGDDKLDVSDINAVVNIILGKI